MPSATAELAPCHEAALRQLVMPRSWPQALLRGVHQGALAGAQASPKVLGSSGRCSTGASCKPLRPRVGTPAPRQHTLDRAWAPQLRSNDSAHKLTQGFVMVCFVMVC